MSTEAKPRWSVRKKLALQLALLPVLLLGTEVLFRVYLAVGGDAYDSARLLERVREIVARVDEPVGIYAPDDNQDEVVDDDRSRIQNPYFAWDFPIAQRDLAKTRRYFRRKQGEEMFDVLILGGSVAGGFARDAGARLGELLSADPRLEGRSVRIHARARGGFKQPQQLNTLGYLLAIGWKPDAVVNLDGFNEVALALYNSTHHAHPVHPSIPHWASLATSARSDRATMDLMLDVRRQQLRAVETAALIERWGLHRSAALGWLALDRMVDTRTAYNDAHLRYTNAIINDARRSSQLGPPHDEDFRAVLEMAIDAWEESSVSIDGICEAHDIPYLHVLQPTLHDEGSKPVTEEERATGDAHEEWIHAATVGYPRMRERADRLRERGVEFVDASMIFAEVEETLYYDACHFHPPGQLMLAEVIARDLLDLLD